MIDHVDITVSDIAAALSSGGRGRGAFVPDPDGHNIEAVCHLPE